MTFEPEWMTLARHELGTTELAGYADDARVMRYFRDVRHGEVRHDETAWCAAFVGACLERAGLRSTRSLSARSYQSWGLALATPRLGCVVVLSRGPDSRLGHVGFLVRSEGGLVYLLGGNQGNAVCIRGYPISRVIAYRWPADAGLQDPAAKPPSVFARALEHVLRMEGGWSNDPYDPGGATNFGITLRDYARSKGVVLTSANAGGLTEELRHISPQTVETIYRERYWHAARCDLLAPSMAVMHFDAAVNHGTNGAGRMLQEALRVPVDGIIGPQTLAAARSAQQMPTVMAYAEIRRRAYRRLRQFWRFGRGWLARLDATLAVARELQSSGLPESEVDPAEKETHMTTSVEPKWWGQSITIWGTIVTTLSTVLPIIGPFIGLDVSGALIVSFGEQVTHVLQALGGVIGTLLTIYGRFRAIAPLQQGLITLRI